MNRGRSFIDPLTIEINSGDTIRKKYGNYEQDETESYRNDPWYKRFCQELRKIHNAGDCCGLCSGNTLLLINRNYGYSWETIPFGRISEIVEFVKSNAKDYLKLVDPVFHSQLISVSAYSIKGGIVNPNFMAGFSECLRILMEKKRPQEEFIEFTKTICNGLIKS